MADISVLQELFLRTLGGPPRRMREFGESYGQYQDYLTGYDQNSGRDAAPAPKRKLTNSLDLLDRLFSDDEEEDEEEEEDRSNNPVTNMRYVNPRVLNYNSEAKRFYDNSEAKRFYDNSNARRFLS